MTILIDVRLLSRGRLSGIEEYTRQIISHLLKRDTENHYKLFYNGVKKIPLPQEWLRKNASVVDWKIPNKIFDFSSRFLNVPKLDKLTGANVIFSPHFNILSSSPKAKKVITFHDLSFIHHPDFFLTKQKIWHWLQNYRKKAEKADKIIVNSNFTKADLMDTLKIPEEKISVIYPGVNPEFKKITDFKALDNFKKQRKIDFPFMLYLGTLEPRKNIISIIKAFELLKKENGFEGLKLVIAGSPGWLYENILAEAKNSKNAREILFWGKVENNDRIFLYNLAEAFVYPSFFEGFGFPPLEAQICGTPAIVSRRTSLTEIIGNTGIMIDPWKISELKKAMEQVLTDKNLKNELSAKGILNAKKFSWDSTALETLKVLNGS